ncbi:MAG: hypothetical protein ACRCZI_15755 [Cetobacterium sp.]
MNEMAKIELSKDLIEPIVRAQLHASILAAMGQRDELIRGVVTTIMNTQVDERGEVSRYSSSKPLITWMAEKAIKETALEAIKEWFADNRVEMKKQIHLALTRQSKQLAEQLISGMVKTTEAGYSYQFSVRVNPKD